MNRLNSLTLAVALIALTSMPIMQASNEKSTISKSAIAERTFRGSVVGFLGGCISALLLGADYNPYKGLAIGTAIGATVGALAGYKSEKRRINRQERPSNTVILTDCAEGATIGTAAGALLGLTLIPANLNRTQNFLPAKLCMCAGALIGLLYTAKDIRNKYALTTDDEDSKNK